MHAILSILTEKLINFKKGGLLLMSYSKTREQFVIIDVLILLKQQIYLKSIFFLINKKDKFFPRQQDENCAKW